MSTNFINDYAYEHLSKKRLKHTEGVIDTAKQLARIYGCDEQKVEIAALCHDLFRNIPIEELNRYVTSYGLSNKYIDNPNLAHGKIAAVKIKEDLHVSDTDILNAISFHTTGRAHMSTLEKVIYIADAIEPGRVYPAVDKLRQLAFSNLDEAVLCALDNTIEYVASQGLSIDEDTISARDYLLKRRNLMDNKNYVLLAAKTLSDKKAEDIIAIDITDKSSFADYMVIATGNSDRQVKSLVDDVEDKFAEEGLLVRNIEGRQSGWILMDFGDIIVNIFTREMREKYNIERVWGDCTFLDIEE